MSLVNDKLAWRFTWFNRCSAVMVLSGWQREKTHRCELKKNHAGYHAFLSKGANTVVHRWKNTWVD